LTAMAAKVGLQPLSMDLSEDGGNIMAVFRPAPYPAAQQAQDVPGNHARVTDQLRAHTPIRHWTGWAPYRRVLRRLAGAAVEAFKVRALKHEHNLLDRVYDDALQGATVARGGSVAVAPFPWVKAGTVYVLAVLLEWLLLDRAFGLHAMSDGQAMVAYLGSQALVVGGVARKMWTRGSTSSWLRITAFGGPLFLLPAYC